MNKGISPLIAGVLLIAFTLAVAAIISGWLTSVTRTATTSASENLQTQTNCAKAALTIEKVSSSAVVIHNIGYVTLQNFTVTCGTDTQTNTTTLQKGGYAKLKLTAFTCDSNKHLVVAAVNCPNAWDSCTVGSDCPT